MRKDYLDNPLPLLSEKEKELERALRPDSFADFAGQEKIVTNLRIFSSVISLPGRISNSLS